MTARQLAVWEGNLVRSAGPAPAATGTILDLFWDTVYRVPTKTALIQAAGPGISPRHWSYRKLAEEVATLGAALNLQGVEPGDRVSLLLPNVPEFAAAYFGVLQAGAVVNPINTRLSALEICHIMNDAGSHTAIVHAGCGQTLLDLMLQGELPHLQAVVWVGGRAPFGAIPWEDYLAAGSGAPLGRPEHPLLPEDLAVVMYTSGTTGHPKGAMMRHRQVVFNAASCQWAFGYAEQDVQMVAVPLFHVTGLNSQLVAGVAQGCTLVLLPEYSRQALLDALVAHRATVFVGVPTMFVLLLLTPGLERADLSRLRTLAYAGAPMAVETVRQLKERFPGVRCHNFYGLTETASITTAHPDAEALTRPASVGVPAPGTVLMVVGEAGRPRRAGEPGELWIRGPQVVAGYWQAPAKTEQAMGGGWLRTGDVAMIDAEGFVHILDRLKDVIIRGGEKVYSKEVEDVLYNHPAVLEATVIGVPDRVMGEQVKALVVPRPGAQVAAEHLRDWVRQHLADFKVPSLVELCDSLPRNPGGKVLKAELRAAARRMAGAPAR